jgi:very-short-patch-repair endonuclease
MENVHFRRQHAIGPYIVDFCAPRHKLIVEVDGAWHHEQKDYDQERTAFLEAKRYRVLRFWNREVEEDIERVIRDILAALEERTPT